MSQEAAPAQRLSTGYPAVLAWLRGTVRELANHSDRLNAINVFPVADGDTGSNLYRTARAALDEIELRPDAKDLGELLSVAGRAGLEQAHGNSGTLLGVFLVGMSEPLRGVHNLTGANLAQALDVARVRSWSALSEPVPGTMLSIIEAAAEAATDTVHREAEHNQGRALLGLVLARALEASYEAVRATESQLRPLGDAQVVDSGAVGLHLVLDCLDCAVTGRTFDDTAYEPLDGYSIDSPPVTDAVEPNHGVEVMCTITADPLQAATLRASLDAVGDSVLMSPVSAAGEGFRWRVHVHVPEQELALAAVSAVAEPQDVSVTSLCTDADD